MAAPAPPPHTTLGLIEGIAANALDDDYYEIRPDTSAGARTGRTMLAALGLALFALLVTIASVQTRHDRPAEQVDRNSLIASIRERQDSLTKGNEQAAKLRTAVAKLQTLSGTDPAYEQLRLTTADQGASGPGVVIEVDNSTDDVVGGRISDTDLQLLVNGLWYAGAEAISINDNRLSSLSAIHRSGQSITVNFTSLTTPYRIVALGDPDSLADRLAENPGGRYWAQRTGKSGLRFDIRAEKSLAVPAAPPKRVSVSNAHVSGGNS